MPAALRPAKHRPLNRIRTAIDPAGTRVGDRRCGSATTGAVAAMILAALATQPVCGERLLVVTASDAPAYRQALAGIRKSAGRLPVEILQLTAANLEASSRDLGNAGRGTAMVALGARANDVATRSGTAAPIVGCMVPAPDAPRGPASAPSVSTDIPVDAQIGWLRRLLPAARNVGLLYDPALNGRRVDALAAALAAAGYTAVRVPVAAPAALPAAIGRLNNAVDVILGLPDATVYSQQAAKALLLFSFRHKIPLVGLSDAWVKAGALYALDWDYEEVGGYCASLAFRQLAAGRPSAPPAPPRPRVAVNLRTAAQLDLNWDPDLIRGVDRTFE